MCFSSSLAKSVVDVASCLYCFTMSQFLRPQRLWPAKPLCPWDPLGNITWVGCHFLLQGIFPAQGLNPGLLHCRQILYWLSHQGSPTLWPNGLPLKQNWKNGYANHWHKSPWNAGWHGDFQVPFQLERIQSLGHRTLESLLFVCVLFF